MIRQTKTLPVGFLRSRVIPSQSGAILKQKELFNDLCGSSDAWTHNFQHKQVPFPQHIITKIICTFKVMGSIPGSYIVCGLMEQFGHLLKKKNNLCIIIQKCTNFAFAYLSISVVKNNEFCASVPYIIGPCYRAVMGPIMSVKWFSEIKKKQESVTNMFPRTTSGL